jgi:hypothetical protein
MSVGLASCPALVIPPTHTSHLGAMLRAPWGRLTCLSLVHLSPCVCACVCTAPGDVLPAPRFPKGGPPRPSSAPTPCVGCVLIPHAPESLLPSPLEVFQMCGSSPGGPRERGCSLGKAHHPAPASPCAFWFPAEAWLVSPPPYKVWAG